MLARTAKKYIKVSIKNIAGCASLYSAHPAVNIVIMTDMN
jgi:hypothetical protein